MLSPADGRTATTRNMISPFGFSSRLRVGWSNVQGVEVERPIFVALDFNTPQGGPNLAA